MQLLCEHQKECVVVAGNHKCCRCLKGKKGCKFMVADEEKEEEGDDDEEEESQKSWWPVAALKKILLLPIHLLHKRKEVNLLPGLVKERAKTLLVDNCSRLELEAPELEVDKDDSMPPPSIVPSQIPSGSSSSSHLFYPTKDFAVRHLQSALRASQEDITCIQEQFASRKFLYLEEIAELKNKLKAGPSKSKGRK